MQVDATVNPCLESKILSYIHIFEYFRDYYQCRKSLDDKFSYELWSLELGFKSRSQMRMIGISGSQLQRFLITLVKLQLVSRQSL